MPDPIPLTDEERARYEWQIWTPGFSQSGQERLKGASVLVSRVGGVGSVVAYELAAAGVGKLVLAHGGNIKPSDLNRQLLMTTGSLGTSRAASAERRLTELNPHVVIETVDANITEDNAADLVARVDMVAACAPLFQERLLMNREAIRQGKPLVDSAMYDFNAQVVTVLPGKTPCLACLYPEIPPAWKREFPVFGAVSGTTACIAAVEVIKILGGVGSPMTNEMLIMDLSDATFMKRAIHRRSNCAVCGGL